MRLKQVRQDLGWSQARLSREAELCQATVCAIELGRLRPYPSQLLKLAQALDWKGIPEELLKESPASCGCRNTSESEGETR